MEPADANLPESIEQPEVGHLNIQIRKPSDLEWAKEVRAFDAMFPELIKLYENKFVVIYQGKVVASGDDKTKLVLATLEQFGNVPFYIHKVSRIPKKAIRMPSSIQFRRVAT